MTVQFKWVEFYTELATKLLEYKNNRTSLIELLQELYSRIGMKLPKLDNYPVPHDIDPFTIFGLFNKGITDANRIIILNGFKITFDISADTPNDFSGIPVLNNMMATFYAFEGDKRRKSDDINNLWEIFECAIILAENDSEQNRSTFSDAYNKVNLQFGVRWNLTMGLYWIRPYTFINLDKTNRAFLSDPNNIPESIAEEIKALKSKPPLAEKYLDICDKCRTSISSGEYGYSSLPELSYQAWKDSDKYSKVVGETTTKYWLYSPGENASNWDELYDAGIMGIGWDRIGDLRKYDSQDDINNALQKTDDSNASQKINAKTLWQFANDMKPGDVVFAKKGTKLIIGKGIIKSDYLFDDDRTEFKHVRKIDWTNKGEWKNSSSAIRKTLTKINAEEAEKLSELLNDSTYKDSNHNYWWLNANPKEWSFSDIEAGTSQSYSFYNEKGNKRRIFQNYQNANVGDLVIGYEATPVLKVVALAKVSAKTTESISFEIVEHLENPIDYKVLKNAPELSGMEFFANPNGSLFKLSKDEYDYITNVIWEERPPVKVQSDFGYYTKTDFLRDVYISDKQYEELCSVLKYKKNIILQGPPGVGKTWMAKRLSWSCMGKMQDDHIKMIQFHQNYSYEDFVCGYKPDDEGFALKTGVFYDFCKKAKSNKGEKFFFIIDEINRGNMSKIFGELLMLIENEYRNEAIQLPYSELPPFEVPDNVYIIGMMNTADRSLAMIDYALRRRFSFFNIEPCFTKHKDKKENEEQANRFWEYIEGLKKDTLMQLIKTIIELNTEITEDLGKGFCIGHSYFCNLDNLKEGITIEERLKEIVKYEIIPMLREYWFDNSDKVSTWENKLLGVISKNEG